MKNNNNSFKNFLAFDFGASNGRAIVAQFNGDKFNLAEIHRFENRPVFLGDTFYWDFLRLFLELKEGITRASKNFENITSIGIDTWGCDFGLLDKDKKLLSNPVHYRDKRTLGMAGKVHKILSEWDIYKKTQAQILEINSLYQLYFLKINNYSILQDAKYFLLLGDLFNFFLTGEITCEFSNASLTELLNQKERKWEKTIIKKLGFPEDIFMEITEPGKIIGKITSNISRELDLKPIPIVVAGYDTTSEITAIPEENNNKNWAYLICGTCAAIGIISDYPIVQKEGLIAGFGNEGGYSGKYHYHKNMVGLWIIQQCRKKWIIEDNKNTSWEYLEMAMVNASETNIFIDVDDCSFEKEIFDMPSAILNYCEKTMQGKPGNIGEILRILYESLILKYILNMKKLERISKRKIEFLHIVGGGSNSNILCQWLSDCFGMVLISGPNETTALGNLLVQVVATGYASNMGEAKKIIGNSMDLRKYYPVKNKFSTWHDKYELYKKVLNLNG